VKVLVRATLASTTAFCPMQVALVLAPTVVTPEKLIVPSESLIPKVRVVPVPMSTSHEYCWSLVGKMASYGFSSDRPGRIETSAETGGRTKERGDRANGQARDKGGRVSSGPEEERAQRAAKADAQ
jgi:hypothetical protein